MYFNLTFRGFLDVNLLRSSRIPGENHTILLDDMAMDDKLIVADDGNMGFGV